jgi:hypothetical protein
LESRTNNFFFFSILSVFEHKFATTCTTSQFFITSITFLFFFFVNLLVTFFFYQVSCIITRKYSAKSLHFIVEVNCAPSIPNHSFILLCCRLHSKLNNKHLMVTIPSTQQQHQEPQPQHLLHQQFLLLLHLLQLQMVLEDH